MPMIVISDRTMCCTECGGFQFLAEVHEHGCPGRWLLQHPDGPMYKHFDKAEHTSSPCPNIGKWFTFPDQEPTLAIEVER